MAVKRKPDLEKINDFVLQKAETDRDIKIKQKQEAEEKVQPTLIRLPIEIHREIKILAAQTGITMTNHLLNAIEEYVARNKKNT